MNLKQATTQILTTTITEYDCIGLWINSTRWRKLTIPLKDIFDHGKVIPFESGILLFKLTCEFFKFGKKNDKKLQNNIL